MLVRDFIQTVQQHPDKPLRFLYDNNQIVPGGYHITEIKNAQFDTIDCGNSLHTWREVILQLWVPDNIEPDAEPMASSKFAKIWSIVNGRIPLNQEAEIRIEYGSSQRLTAVYHVDELQNTPEGIIVKIAPPRTLCKPRELIQELNGYSECVDGNCTPQIRHETEQAVPLPAAPVTGSCC
ncbi:DUF6428 family protein [Candidatus Leptofilum sp.]|uniref:DUF6428 family protein n=1 Tax=Candidatus Leptofilum sp. TaxID=3241576 RepID=UPI003B5A5399